MAEVETSDAPETPEADAAEESPYADLIAAIKKPISGDNACGEDVRYDEQFQELKREVDKLGGARADSVEFDLIIDLGRTILDEKAKDLTTAGYLILGLSRSRELEGMAEGFVIMQAIVEEFWENLHPKKPVRRRNAIQFAADKTSEWLERRLQEQRPTAADRQALEETRDAAKALQDITMRELQDLAPAMSGVLRALEEQIRRLPKPEPKPESKPEAKTPAGTASGDAESRPATSAVSAPSEIASNSDAMQAVSKAVGFLRDQDRTDPAPYAVMRALRWGSLSQEPPNEGGKTRIPAPQPQRLTYLNGLLEKAEYAKIVEEAEASFQQAPFYFWLGLQRLLGSAMEALGAPYRPARDVVLLHTAALLVRLPGYRNLTFNDGTSFVDPMTQEWLDTSVAPLLGGGGGTGGGGGGSDHLAVQFDEARRKLGGGDLGGALALMQEGSGEDSSQADRFRRRLYVATLCVRGNQPAVARPMLESLDEDVKRHALDAWDPALTLDVWSNLYTCYNTLVKTAPAKDKPEFAAQASGVLDKIARLDAGYALTILGNS